MKTSTLNIRGLRVRPVVVPMRLPLQTSTGAVSMAPLVLIDLDTTAGITGRAYLFAIGRPHLAPIVALVEAMGEMLAGDAVAPFEIERKLRRNYTLLGVHNIVLFALAGIDMAAWDAYAQSLAQPLCKVLGGAPRPVRAYNSKGLGIMPLKPLAREAEQLVKEGFSAVKLRLGRPDAHDDLAALRTVKKALGPEITLMCDFNQALSVNDAILRGRMLDDEGLYWIEEPTRHDDYAGYARICAELQTPIQTGENLVDIYEMVNAIALESLDYVMPDIQRIGGVTGWLRAAALAHAHGIEMSSHLFPEFSCHLLAVTPTAHWLEYVDWAASIIQEPVQIKDGHVLIPDRPGAGIVWNEEAVKRYAA